MKARLIVAAVALSLLGSAANAATQLDNQTVTTYFGTGNSPCCWSTATEQGLQIGLKAQIRGVASPIVPTANVFTTSLGTNFNADFSIDPSQGYGTSLNGLSFRFTITDLANNVSSTFNPVTFLGDNATDPSKPGAIQNSEFAGFGFMLGSDFNKNLNDTYKIQLTALGGSLASPLTVTDFVSEGTGLAGFAGGVPEPASWALMMIGLGFVGSALRNRRVVHA